MFRRYFAFPLLAASFLILFPVTALADVLVEPNNSFYTRHADQCEQLGRSFYANSPDGYVSVKAEPSSNAQIAAVENGETFYIEFTYNHKGRIWGVTDGRVDKLDAWISGWMPMDQLLPVYDTIAFEEEHQSELYDAGYQTLKEAETVFFWSWPGSGETVAAFTPEELGEFRVVLAYTDGQGREWGKIGYWHGYRDVWVCLSDPANDAIPAFYAPPEPKLWPASAVLPDNGFSVPWLIILCVAALAAVTAVLIRVFWKPKKAEPK